MKALVVMDSSLETLELCDELTRAGLYTQHAPSGLYALTMLERDKPNLIVASQDLGDMGGTDLLEIVREDGTARETVFVLLAESASNLSPNDVLMPPSSSHAEIIHRAELLLGLEPGMTNPENLPSLLAAEQPTPEISVYETGIRPASPPLPPTNPTPSGPSSGPTPVNRVAPVTPTGQTTPVDAADEDGGFANLMIDPGQLGNLDDEPSAHATSTPNPSWAATQTNVHIDEDYVPDDLESEGGSILSGEIIEFSTAAPSSREESKGEAFADPPVSGNFDFANRGFIRVVEMMASVSEHSCMAVRCGPEHGSLYFSKNRLIHAEWAGMSGEDALRAAFLAASDHKGGQFALSPMGDENAQSIQITINKPVNQILLTWSA